MEGGKEGAQPRPGDSSAPTILSSQRAPREPESSQPRVPFSPAVIPT